MADQAAPSLNLTAEEKRVFGQLFRQADSENIGVVTGEVAVKFFEKTRLEPRILGEIWQIADKENRGLLTPAGFGIVLRLIGHYQAGQDPTPELALRPGPLPKFDGGSAPGMSPTIQPPPGPPPSALQPQTSGSAPIRVPPLTPEKAAQYAALFEKSGAQNGVLPGEQAKQIFERAGLPNEVLGRIWMLADTEGRGSLQATEFVVAMHLLASFKSGQLRALPALLPAGLYEAASRRPQSRQATTSGVTSAIPRQFSGSGQLRNGSPLARSASVPPPQQFPQVTGSSNDWAITPADQIKFEGIYKGLDLVNKGYITGEEAVPFFSESKLPEEALAQIWDLADINSAGRLTRDEFAVAMYLIRQQRGKRDGRETLPATLPANLIPPSMRNQARPTAVPTAPVFADPAPSLPKSATEDLFGLDALSSPAVEQVPQSTGGSTSFSASNDPFRNAPSSPSQSAPQQSMFKPFAPTSSFGQTLTSQATGGSSGSGPSVPRSLQQQNSATEDLLGDNDPEISKRLTNETTELANLSNQVGSLSKQMQDVQGQRSTTQNDLNQASTQKREFETRLAQLRTLYEKEVKDVRVLQERLTASRNETKKLHTDIAMLEGTYQDLQNQHRQTLAALQADQQENAILKERMRVVNTETTQLKPALEKLRSDARQQKGLVAINKKQLATNEAEREKLKAEAEDLNRSIKEDTETLAAASANASRVQSPAQVASPAPSTMSATNPFFRPQGSTSELPSSPFAAASPVPQQKDRSFENVFGPAFGAGASGTTEAAPATTFKQETSPASPLPISATSHPMRAQTTGSSQATSSSSPTAPTNREIPSSLVPPPPPESRQMSSSFLPFPTHIDSVSSSRQVSAPNSRSGEGSSGANTPTNYMGQTPTGSSVAAPSESTRAISPGFDRRSNASPTVPEHKDSIPGAFPGDSNSGIIATPTGGSTLSEQAAADPFGMKAPERTGSAKDDFDSAFAGFGGQSAKAMERSNTGSSAASGSAGPTVAGFNKEFPPIAEMEQDDDTDTGSEGGGFDDDFAPASPGHARKASSTTPAPTSPKIANTDSLGVRPTVAQQSSAMSTSTNPPTPDAQNSPPMYDKVVSPSEQAHSEAQQYSGLLPSREVPKSFSPEPPTNPTAAGQPPFGYSALSAPTIKSTEQTPFGIPQVSSQTTAPPKAPFDDDFDDFADLEDAKEGDADDELANSSNHDRSGLDDFNPMFDSPPPSKIQEHTSHQNNGFGNTNAFGDFTTSPTSTTHQPMTNTATTTTTVNDSHDWDAIFAGLDSAPTAPELSPPATGLPTKMTSNGTRPNASERPQVGRALTEAGVHDDPILKNLTGMGYKRTDALAALEKYDYNLERAANYLASQS